MDEKDPGEFLRRWSRLKTQAQEAPAQPAGEEDTAPVLPALETLTPESDFRAFFHPKVDESLRRAALKKLFADPHFNVMDGLDVYIDDYSKGEPLPAAMLEKLEQARKILRWAREDEEEQGREEQRRSGAREETLAAAKGADPAPLAAQETPPQQAGPDEACGPPPREGAAT